MRYVVERNFVQVVGTIWMPPVRAAMEISLRDYDLENIGEFTRDNVDRWLACNAGDFQAVDDFYATAGDEEIEWADEDNGFFYQDAVYGEED